MAIDLHMHTNFSDGTLSPEELVDYAQRYGVHTMAVTDHDEIGAVQRAIEYGKSKKRRVIAGVELSIDYPLKGRSHLHILGLFIDYTNGALNEALQYLKVERQVRIHKILELLRGLNIPLDINNLNNVIGQGSAGRPHIANLLIEKNYVRTTKQAFDRFLSKGRPAYVSKVKLKLKEAIDVIHAANGLAILAHPISLGFNQYEDLGRKILKLKESGIDGIEAYYPSQDFNLTNWLLNFAEGNKLSVAGGSDFHGQAKPEIKPGIGKGQLNIPENVFHKLQQDHRQKYGGTS
ncbi:MAG: PHP domain-containing protein [Caldithrix sp.]|nr:PHP domain-containing protein [Caldithrix sp.]